MTQRATASVLECDLDRSKFVEVLTGFAGLPHGAPCFAAHVDVSLDSDCMMRRGEERFRLIVAANDNDGVDCRWTLPDIRDVAAFIRTLSRPRGDSMAAMTLPVEPGADGIRVNVSSEREVESLILICEEADATQRQLATELVRSVRHA